MAEGKIYNLEDRRPQVLLLGNGLVYDEGISWSELLRSIRREEASLEGLWEGEEDSGKPTVPNNIFCDATAIVKDRERQNACVKAFSTAQKKNKASAGSAAKCGNHDDDLIQLFLSLCPDAILTTNYTYQIEDRIRPGYSALSNDTKRKYAYNGGARTKDGRFIIRTRNVFGEDLPEIWHIHGELRRKSSLVLTHDEYFREVKYIYDYNAKRGNDYLEFRNDFKVKSWIDYFMIADIYVVGLSFDFSEFDLWWLLNRRQRENAGVGNICFYEMEDKDTYSKICALRQMKVEPYSLGYKKTDQQYNAFYKAVAEDIKEKMGER